MGIRRGFTVFQVLCLFIGACAQTTVQDHVSPADEITATQVEEPVILKGSDLGIWSKVDTLGINAGVVEALRNFFDEKMQQSGAEQQNFWISGEYEQFVRDYPEIRYAEYGSDATVKYWPTLIAIEEVEGNKNQRLATVRWASIDELGSTDEVRYVFQFLLKPDALGVLKLSAPTACLTKDWDRKQVGEVSFVLSPKHRFSRKQAEEQQKAIEGMVDFFEIAPFPITFYSFKDAAELLQTRGYLQHPLLYKFETGGQAGVGDVVYSGNDRDEYIHEVVHLFILRKIPSSTGLLNEGLATLIGGSSGRPYEWHLEKLKAWLMANPDVDLTNHLNPYQSQYIEEHTSIPYTIGARLCEVILEQHGKEVLFEALEKGKDPWAYLEELGIEQSGLRKILQ